MRQKTGVLGIGVVVCLMLGLRVSAAPAAESGLLGWWKFDEGKGLVLRDSSGKGNDGEIDGATWVPGRKGPALKFDALNQSAVVFKDNPAFYPTNAFTVEIWFKAFPNQEREAYLLALDYQWKPKGGSGIALFMRGTPYDKPVFHDVIQFEACSLSAKAAAAKQGLKPDAWYYYSVTGDGRELKFYLDGALVSAMPFAAPVAYAHKKGGDFSIGDLCGNFNFSGLIAGLRIYNRPLSAAEIKLHYSQED